MVSTCSPDGAPRQAPLPGHPLTQIRHALKLDGGVIAGGTGRAQEREPHCKSNHRLHGAQLRLSCKSADAQKRRECEWDAFSTAASHAAYRLQGLTTMSWTPFMQHAQESFCRLLDPC